MWFCLPVAIRRRAGYLCSDAAEPAANHSERHSKGDASSHMTHLHSFPLPTRRPVFESGADWIDRARLLTLFSGKNILRILLSLPPSESEKCVKEIGSDPCFLFTMEFLCLWRIPFVETDDIAASNVDKNWARPVTVSWRRLRCSVVWVICNISCVFSTYLKFLKFLIIIAYYYYIKLLDYLVLPSALHPSENSTYLFMHWDEIYGRHKAIQR